MRFPWDVQEYVPINDQEEKDKKGILECIQRFPDTILFRENEIVHITSSGFIINKTKDKVLMIHHKIRDTWGWTGGHADGDPELLQVAIREAQEETGVNRVSPLSGEIASLDILPVPGHEKEGAYISAHLHLSVAFILVADDSNALVCNERETNGVRWFGLNEFREGVFSRRDLNLYRKLLRRMIPTRPF